MEEIIKSLGVKPESQLMAFLAATIFACLRIFETEVPPTRRKIIYTIVSGLATALLVPGLVVKITGTDDPYYTGFYTAVVVTTFEIIVQLIKNKVIKKIKSEDDNEPN